jgi:hypothetical protein
MTPSQKRQFNTIFGGVFLTGGILAWMIAFYFAIFPSEPVKEVKPEVPKVDMESCKRALRTIGYNDIVISNGSDITVFEPKSDSLKDQLVRASLASTLCHIPMHSFCMGVGCSRPGLTLVLRQTASAGSTAPNAQAKPVAKAQAAAPK